MLKVLPKQRTATRQLPYDTRVKQEDAREAQL